MLSALLLLLTSSVAKPSLLAAESLPPFELARGLRSAHIAHVEGDHGRELETLQQTRELFPGDASLTYALLVYHRDHATSEEQLASLRVSINAELAAPGAETPIWLLTQIVHDLHADDVTVRHAAAQLERRSRAGGPPELRILEPLSEAYGRLRERDSRIDVLERLLDVSPTEMRRWQLLHLYRSAERYAEAAAFVESWLEMPDAPRYLDATLIRLLGRLGRVEELMAQVDRLLAGSRAGRAMSDAAFHIGIAFQPVRGGNVILDTAWNLRDAGHDAAAEQLLRKLLAAYPEHETTRETLVLLYGSDEEQRAFLAGEAEELAAESDPHTLFSEGTDRLTAGDAAAAYELLKRAASGLPQLEAAWYNLGMAAYQVEAWEDVAEAFGRAGELNDQRVQTFFYRGLALEKLGRCAEAVEALEKALALDPSKTLAHYYLATCYQWLGQMEKSKKHRALYDAAQ